MSDDLLNPDRDTDETASSNGQGSTKTRDEYPRVGDPDDIAQTRSHQRVQALLDEITNSQIREANDLDGEYSKAEHRRAYHGTVTELWRELQPTLADAADDIEEYYWFGIDLGDFTVEPPAPIREPETRAESEAWPDLRPGATWAEPEHYDITGFHQFAEMDVVVRTRWNIRLDEDTITVPQLRERIGRNDPGGNYKVWERSGRDFEEPFRVDKFRLLPKSVINNARGALREFAEQSGHGFGKPDFVDEPETDPI